MTTINKAILITTLCCWGNVLAHSNADKNKLIGSWVSECKLFAKKGFMEDIFGKSYRIVANFYNNQSLDYKKLVYKTPDCRHLTHDIAWSATYFAPKVDAKNKPIDFVLKSILLTARDPQISQRFECWKGQWSLNQPRPVAGIDCDGDPSNGGYGREGLTFLNIYRANAFKLLLDFDNSGLKGQLPRPTKIAGEAELYKRGDF